MKILMFSPELHIIEAAGWRALLTHAQTAGGVGVSPLVEEHMMGILFRHVGAQLSQEGLGNDFTDQLEQTITGNTANLAAIVDQCLVFAELFPGHAFVKGIPVTYFVRLGRNTCRDYSARHYVKIHGV